VGSVFANLLVPSLVEMKLEMKQTIPLCVFRPRPPEVCKLFFVLLRLNIRFAPRRGVARTLLIFFLGV